MIDGDLVDVGLAPFPVKFVDMVLPAAVHVDSLVVNHERGGEEIDFADDPFLGGGFVDDDHILFRSAAQADRLSRVDLGHPVPPFGGLVDDPVFVKIGEDLLG